MSSPLSWWLGVAAITVAVVGGDLVALILLLGALASEGAAAYQRIKSR